MEKIYENAARKKYRFPYRGMVTVEDLWDLPVTELDEIFKDLNAKAKKENEKESLLEAKTGANAELSEKIAIIRHIVEVKCAEAEARRTEAEKARKNQKIMDIISRKKEAALENLSVEELTKLLNE